MIILIMIKFIYLATLQNVETHLSFITLDYVPILNMTFNISRTDLESDKVDSLWIELQFPVRSVFIGFTCRNLKDIVWEDQFCNMLDNIVSLNKEYSLLGDFNIDLTFPKHRWNSYLQLVLFSAF